MIEIAKNLPLWSKICAKAGFSLIHFPPMVASKNKAIPIRLAS
jgi:hypothetical protein